MKPSLLKLFRSDAQYRVNAGAMRSRVTQKYELEVWHTQTCKTQTILRLAFSKEVQLGYFASCVAWICG